MIRATSRRPGAAPPGARGPESRYYGGSGNPKGRSLCGIGNSAVLEPGRARPATEKPCRTAGARTTGVSAPGQGRPRARHDPRPRYRRAGPGGASCRSTVPKLHDARAGAGRHLAHIIGNERTLEILSCAAILRADRPCCKSGAHIAVTARNRNGTGVLHR